MVNKVVIMAAGKGTRMLPLTSDIPKPLIEINGKPFLYYLMNNLNKAGYDDIGIIVGYKAEKIEIFLREHNFNATLISQDEQLGTGHAVKTTEKFVNGKNFLVLAGDHLWSVEDLKRFNIDDDMNYIAGLKHKNPEHYGVLLEENEYLKAIIEKPKKFVGDLINISLYKFTPEIFQELEELKESSRKEYELTDAVTMLAKQEKVKVIKIKDFWLNLGVISDILKIEKFISKGEI